MAEAMRRCELHAVSAALDELVAVDISEEDVALWRERVAEASDEPGVLRLTETEALADTVHSWTFALNTSSPFFARASWGPWTPLPRNTAWNAW